MGAVHAWVWGSDGMSLFSDRECDVCGSLADYRAAALRTSDLVYLCKSCISCIKMGGAKRVSASDVLSELKEILQKKATYMRRHGNTCCALSYTIATSEVGSLLNEIRS